VIGRTAQHKGALAQVVWVRLNTGLRRSIILAHACYVSRLLGLLDERFQEAHGDCAQRGGREAEREGFDQLGLVQTQSWPQKSRWTP